VELAENRVEQSGAGVAEKQWSRAGGRRVGTEWGAGLTEIGWSAERFFRRSRSAYMLCMADADVGQLS